MLDSLKSLLEEQVKDLYSAEKQLVAALPKMAKAATNPSLKEAFESHLEETRHHVEVLEQVAALLEIKPSGKKCKAMEGLVAEGAEAVKEEGEPSLVDAAIVAAAQRVEHYEIAAYGTARTFAERLGNSKAAALFESVLKQEKAADEKLSEICTEELLVESAAAEPAERTRRRS